MLAQTVQAINPHFSTVIGNRNMSIEYYQLHKILCPKKAIRRMPTPLTLRQVLVETQTREKLPTLLPT